jgi:ABC-type multidrug transport system fused ATPase/permease subunit
MTVVMALMEALGVASIMPFVAVLADPTVVASNRYLNAVHRALGFTTTDSFLVFLGGVVFVVTIGSTALKALTTWAILSFSHKHSHALSYRLFEGYLHQPYAWFLRRHSANLTNVVLSEVGEASGALLAGMQLIAHGAVATLIVALLVAVDPLLAFVVTLALGGAYGLVHWITRKYQTRIGEERLEANHSRYRASSEALSGIKDVKLVGREAEFLGRFAAPSQRYANRQIAAKLVSEFPQYALQVIAFGGILLIVQYQLLTRGSIGQALPLIALYALAGYRLLPALQQVYRQVARLRMAMPAVDALHRDFAANEPVLKAAHAAAGSQDVRFQHLMEIRNVVYRYPGAPAPAVDGVTLAVPARSTVGLVGRTGSGKTTLVDILLGLHEPGQGALIVDGTPIGRHNARAWRRCVGHVPQEVFLVDDTMAANIAFGIPPAEIDMAAVERAARSANLHGFVSTELEQGYRTLLGERGVRLSGGQRQRVGIARALYHDPQVLVFDEATSALDNITERAVMDSVGSLEHQKTIVMVAHRLSTVRRCDVICLLDRGRVVASGSYDELMQRSAHFKAMVSANG